MLGKRSDQRGLWEADRWYLDYVGKDTFYGLLASLRGQRFSDDEFAEIYCPGNGRDSVPPSLLATALLLQTYDKVSDAEAKARADFDISWKVALGIEIEDKPFARSTLQLFRAQLILHEKVREVFESSLRLARRSGYLKKRGMRVALDTTYILGRGAVKDTHNLLADGIVKLLRALAAVANATLPEWAEAQGYEKYLGSSIKGEAAIDWSDRKARAALLTELVADADRLLELARQAWVELPEDSVAAPRSKVGASTATRCVPAGANWSRPAACGGSPDVAGPRALGRTALGRTALGLAGAHGAGAIDAVLPTAGTSAQEAHRLGATDGHAAAPLAAAAPTGAGGRQQLRRAGPAPLLPIPP